MRRGNPVSYWTINHPIRLHCEKYTAVLCIFSSVYVCMWLVANCNGNSWAANKNTSSSDICITNFMFWFFRCEVEFFKILQQFCPVPSLSNSFDSMLLTYYFFQKTDQGWAHWLNNLQQFMTVPSLGKNLTNKCQL